MINRLGLDFYQQDVIEVAPALCGKLLVRRMDGVLIKRRIVETEAYRGQEDLACHARAGRTKRTEVLYQAGGVMYLYRIYGLYWMLNIVTGREDEPQAVLIRGVEGKLDGPGKLTRALEIDGRFNRESLIESSGLWIEEDGAAKPAIITGSRVGVDYAPEPWRSMAWRFMTREQGDES